MLAEFSGKKGSAYHRGLFVEAQCGFQKGRDYCNMIFVAQQLLKKACEHQELLFTFFVNLRKAYDSVPKLTLWQVLKKSIEFLLNVKNCYVISRDMHAEVIRLVVHCLNILGLEMGYVKGVLWYPCS